MIGKGKTLFEGGVDTVWGEKGFDFNNLVHPNPVPVYQKYGGLSPRCIIILICAGAFVVILITLIYRKKKKHRFDEA